MTPNKLQPALLGGAFIGILSALPFISAGNVCCCLWIVSGGLLAAYVMQQNHPEPVAPADGAIVGLLSGVFGAIVYAFVSIPFNLILGPMQRRMIERFLENAQDVPTGLRDAVESMGSGAIGLMIGFFFMMFAGIIFATLGGLLGAVIFRKKLPPAPPT
ncbi:MAG: hypothetical protein HYX76_13095 [Acidobacteria bacterium]|nr:hypothetical protein [Acidobacteriota bacterium]